jgi:hypothetical protein
MVTIAHIINPFLVQEEKAEQFIAQTITFQAMKNAARHAAEMGQKVELLYTCYDEDIPMLPDGIEEAGILQRSALDINDFKLKRKLPLIADVLDSVAKASDADYFVYTNVDISPMPHFYSFINSLIERGFDGIVINRRTISKEFKDVSQISEMYAAIGKKHPGFDCFVIKREHLEKFDLGNVLVGGNWIGRALICNVAANAEKFALLEDHHLTFHIGDDQTWQSDKMMPYHHHNEDELLGLLTRIRGEADYEKVREVEAYYGYHLKNRKDRPDPAPYNTMKGENAIASLFKDGCSPLRQDPIFIIGYPRSGTTMLQSLIATQPGIASFPETHFFSIVAKDFKDLKDLKDPNAPIGIKAARKMLNTAEERLFISEDAKSYIYYLAENKLLSLKMLFEVVVVSCLLNSISPDQISATRWLEKTPAHAFHVNEILQFYPAAKTVFIHRNPINAIPSYIESGQQWQGKNLTVPGLARLWASYTKHYELFKGKYPDSLSYTRLEDLVDDLEASMGRITDFLGLSLVPDLLSTFNEKAEQMSEPWETWKTSVKTDSVSESIVNRRNKKTLNLAEQKEVVGLLGPLMKQYGYQPMPELLKAFELFSSASFADSSSVNPELSTALKNLGTISFLKHPLKKLKAYKAMMESFERLQQ